MEIGPAASGVATASPAQRTDAGIVDLCSSDEETAPAASERATASKPASDMQRSVPGHGPAAASPAQRTGAGIVDLCSSDEESPPRKRRQAPSSAPGSASDAEADYESGSDFDIEDFILDHKDSISDEEEEEDMGTAGDPELAAFRQLSKEKRGVLSTEVGGSTESDLEEFGIFHEDIEIFLRPFGLKDYPDPSIWRQECDKGAIEGMTGLSLYVAAFMLRRTQSQLLALCRKHGLGDQWQGPPNGTSTVEDIPQDLQKCVLTALVGYTLEEAALRIGMVPSQFLQRAREVGLDQFFLLSHLLEGDHKQPSITPEVIDATWAWSPEYLEAVSQRLWISDLEIENARRVAPYSRWSAGEMDMLMDGIEAQGGRKWGRIASAWPGARPVTPDTLRDRWRFMVEALEGGCCPLTEAQRERVAKLAKQFPRGALWTEEQVLDLLRNVTKTDMPLTELWLSLAASPALAEFDALQLANKWKKLGVGYWAGRLKSEVAAAYAKARKAAKRKFRARRK